MSGKPSVLLIRLSSLGDIILTTPAIRAIRDRYPEARIDYVLSERFVNALANHPEVSRVIIFPKKRLKELWKARKIALLIGEICSFIREVRQVRYDYVIDLHNTSESALVALFANGSVKAGNRRQLLSLLFQVRATFDDGFETTRLHSSVAAIRYVVESGCLNSDEVSSEPHMEFYLPDSVAAEVDTLVAAYGLTGKSLIGINPGGSYPFRRWHEERFAAVADYLHRNYGVIPLIFGSPSEKDIVGRIMAKMTAPAIDTSSVTFFQAAELIRRLTLFVTNDSAPMHFAAAFDTPTVALHGSLNTNKFYVLSRNAIDISADLDCIPCKNPRKCSKPRWECWEMVSVAQVCEACSKLLQQTIGITNFRQG